MATVTGAAEADVDFDIDCEPVDGADGEYQNGGARRPMNAFLIFCKRHRSLVREKYPHLENRSVTKILGELWANLDSIEKVTYTELAKQYKEAFMKANPDFKWYKLPSSVPLRSPPNTRPTNQRQQLGSGSEQSSDQNYQIVGNKTEVTSSSLNPSSSMAIVAANPCPPPPPTMSLFKLADETQMGGLSSLINSTKTPSPPSVSVPFSVISSPTPANLISKPPKKRYLENGAFRSQPFDGQNSITSSSQTSVAAAAAVAAAASAVKGDPPLPLSSSSSSTDASAAPSVTAAITNDCSALLKLAEMCSHELVRGGPVQINSNNAHMKGIIVNGGTMCGGGSGNTSIVMTSSSPPSNALTGSQQPSSNTDFGLTNFGKLMANAVRANLAASGGRTNSLNLFLSGQEYARTGDGNGSGSGCPPATNKAVVEDQPLDLCTEKTITTSHQELIDCIVDTVLCRDDKKAPYTSSRLQGFLDGGSKGRGGGGNNGGGAGSGGAGSGGQCRPSSWEHQGGDRTALSLPLKKAKGIRDGSRCSPCGESGGAFSDADDGSSPRKPQRSCKGKRYQAMLSEGIFQSAKERKLSTTNTITKKSSVGGDDEMMSSSAGGLDMSSSSSPTGPHSGTRTLSDSSESTASRRSDREDVLQQRSSRSEAMDHVPSISSQVRVGADSAVNLTDRDHQRKRFKTGDFDLDVHIAALPECNIDALKCKKQRRQGSSSPAGGRKGAFREDGDSKRGSSDNESGVRDASQSEDSCEASGHSSSESRGMVVSKKHRARKRYMSASNSSSVESAVVDNFKLVALAEVCEEQMSSGDHHQQQQHCNEKDSATGSA